MNFDLVVDADGKILGRIASFVAKELLKGKRVAIVNAEKAIITGNPRTILEKYKKRRSIQSTIHPRKSPIQPRTPDRIVWKTVKGMLPTKKAKGREAIRRLRVYIGVPDELKDVEKDVGLKEDPNRYIKYTVESLKPKKSKRYVTVLWLSKELGWKGVKYAEQG
ncbi:MAG: 50S ribosomal protein L13 [Candidatus Korarchaeota archaeon]|nr:50S ribosomal protein L13 [Candidatus Korarchaeota archaeon]